MAKKFNKGQVKIQDFGTEKRAVLDNIRPLLFHGANKVTNFVMLFKVPFLLKNVTFF